jgi:NitT/TauT family transport system ATP-binding protein
MSRSVTDPEASAKSTYGRSGATDILALEHVSFTFPSGLKVLGDVSLRVKEGSVIGVVGPSGCGKTTLLSIIAGLYAPTAGRVVWTQDGSNRARHPLTMLFQRDTLLPWLTTEDNVGLYFNLGGARVSRKERRERVSELIRLAGLEGAERRYPYQLSGGMRRRAAFLAAVAPRPRLLLLDEPFSALDEPTRVVLHQDIYSIIKGYGIGVVLVTHDLAEAISLSDQVIVLSAVPAVAVHVHEVDFGQDRHMLSLRKEHAFLDTYASMWDQLQTVIAKASKTEEHTEGGPG